MLLQEYLERSSNKHQLRYSMFINKRKVLAKEKSKCLKL